jgi:hypothetical protein
MAVTCPRCGSPLGSDKNSSHSLDCPRCSTALLLPAIRVTPAPRVAPPPFNPRTFASTSSNGRTATATPTFGRRHSTAAPEPRALSPVLFILIAAGTAILFLGSALLFRAPFVEARPSPERVFATAAPRVDSRSLSIQDVAASRIVVGQQPILMVGGEIANNSLRELSVPDVRVVLRDGAAREIFAWTVHPEEATLAPGASVRFKSRVAAPAGMGNLELSFVAPE